MESITLTIDADRLVVAEDDGLNWRCGSGCRLSNCRCKGGQRIRRQAARDGRHRVRVSGG